ncbi:MAG TPA: AbrB/MazE/SpoVT family DNA-binding domain-containing protein [Candidatus Saccharimonadales bacterium]|nr:AbrB/MazE/SpoVT family DNA-binding domain-containing protein [Candidatus Saccharimonadales bacterium]
MNTTTVSSKYQIVIPKALREQLHIKPGQTVYLYADKNGEIIVSTQSRVAGLYGSMKGVWGGGADDHITSLRAEADRDRA